MPQNETTILEPSDAGYYWVVFKGGNEAPFIAEWDHEEWWTCGSEVGLMRAISWREDDERVYELVVISGPLEVPSYE